MTPDLTDHQATTPLPPDLTSRLERLAAYEAVAEQLWPYVRYFAIGGAHPDAIAAVVELGRLLGKHQADCEAIGDAVRTAQRDAIVQIADWFEESPYFRSMLSSMRVNFLRDLRGMAATK